jgi:pimeloyl-ACP methyl ester carboxylesterase
MFARALTAVVMLASAVPAAAQTGQCAPPNVGVPIRCVTIDVFENRASRAGRKIALRVVVIPRLDSSGAPRAYFVLTGGPGQGAGTTVRVAVIEYRELRRTHDIVLVDQRGTGESGALGCPAPSALTDFFGAIFPRATLRTCQRSLAARADLDAYGTEQAMDDLDDVRAALGYETIDLEGQSYGSRAARVYARRHPDRVRSLVLLGVVPDDYRLPSQYAPAFQGALDSTVADCERDAECSRAHPRLRQDLASVVRRLRQGTTPARVRSPTTGEMLDVRVSLGDFTYGLRGLLYNQGVVTLPGAITQAVSGDFTAVAQAYLNRASNTWRGISIGMHLAVVCSEDVVHVTDAQREASRATIIGTYLIDEYAAACRDFAPRATPRHPDRGALPNVPVLLLSGRRDPVTPPQHAARVAAAFLDQLHVVFPTGGHGYWGDTPVECARRIRDRFVQQATTRGLDVSCVR